MRSFQHGAYLSDTIGLPQTNMFNVPALNLIYSLCAPKNSEDSGPLPYLKVAHNPLGRNLCRKQHNSRGEYYPLFPGIPFSRTSLTQSIEEIMFGNPVVVKDNKTTWVISSGVAPDAKAFLV